MRPRQFGRGRSCRAIDIARRRFDASMRPRHFSPRKPAARNTVRPIGDMVLR